MPELLRKGGGGGKGAVLEDSQTLAECGLTYSMGIHEARQPRGVRGNRGCVGAQEGAHPVRSRVGPLRR